MKQLYKFRPKLFLNQILTVSLLFTITWNTAANDIRVSIFYTPLTAVADTIKPLPKKDSISPIPVALADTNRLPGNDSVTIKQKIDTFSLKISKDSMDAPLKYEAADSVVVLIQDKKILLYGKTKTEYKDITLTAPKVEVDQQTQIVTAVNFTDSTGEVKELAEFTSGENNFTSDTIRYNFKTQVGLTQNTFTEQGEFHVHGDVAKQVDAGTTFIKRARFSTCNLDHPHFAIVTPKMKVINKKLAVSGPAHMEFEDVPNSYLPAFWFLSVEPGPPFRITATTVYHY